MPGFFLQTEKENDNAVLLKLTRVIPLSLVESKPDKWKNHFRRENVKWVIFIVCDKKIYGTLNDAILSRKKLAKNFGD